MRSINEASIQNSLGSYVVLAGLWEKPTLQLQVYQLAYGIGALAVPFLVEPFLSKEDAFSPGKLQRGPVSVLSGRKGRHVIAVLHKNEWFSLFHLTNVIFRRFADVSYLRALRLRWTVLRRLRDFYGHIFLLLILDSETE